MQTPSRGQNQSVTTVRRQSRRDSAPTLTRAVTAEGSQSKTTHFKLYEANANILEIKLIGEERKKPDLPHFKTDQNLDLPPAGLKGLRHNFLMSQTVPYR